MYLPMMLTVAAGISGASSVPADFKRTPLPDSHPLIGAWRVDLADVDCFEVYEFKADGTKRSRSAAERNTSEFSIANSPSHDGYYLWLDLIIENNGEGDCGGRTTPLGSFARNFIRFGTDQTSFLLCSAAEEHACYAEFYRVKSED